MDFLSPTWLLFLCVLCVLPLVRCRLPLLALLFLCAGSRMVCAEWIAHYYVARTRWHQNWLDQARHARLHKVIVDPAGVIFGPPGHNVSPYWSTGVECLLLSAKNGPDATVSVITTDDMECPEVATHLDKFIFRCWDVLETDYLDPRYFKLPAGSYMPLAGN